MKESVVVSFRIPKTIKENLDAKNISVQKLFLKLYNIYKDDIKE